MPFDFLCCVRPGIEDVMELDYSHQSLADVPTDVFVYERTLETLLCQCNHITELPRQLFMCHGLKHLDLSDNELQTIPAAVSSLVNLQHLNVSRNTLASIPEAMKALKYLTFLDLSVNPLEKLPDAITNLIALQELYLNDTYLEYLPGNFGRLANMRILELRDNYLMILPKSLSRSTELLRLDIGQNEFQQFPEVIGRFLKLKELWIDSNSLTNIPGLIKPLESLIHLEASNNMIEELATEIGYCSELVDLSLSTNSLTQLPDSIGQLCKLTTLKLDNNRLYSLPESIGQLQNLEELMLMCNYLDSIPASIGLLRKLQYLNVDENLLRFIPPEIGSCTKLSVLSLRSNKLTKIPPEIGHLSSLRVLNLVRNSLSCLPQSLLNCDNLVALWLSENQSKPLVPMHSEVDPNTYEQVLTCFLFPQVPLSPVESKLNNEKNENTENTTPARHISFVDMKAAPKVPEKPGQLRRAPTPYPKELRALAKHARNIHKDGTQDTPMLQNAIHIKAAKITPTLQQKFASDNKKEIEACSKDTSISFNKGIINSTGYENVQSENPYDRPLELNYESNKTYKSVDHSLYPDNKEEVCNEFRNHQPDQFQDPKAFYGNKPNEIYLSKSQLNRMTPSHVMYGVHKELEQNCQHNNDSYQMSDRSSLNEVHNQFQRLNLTSQDRKPSNETVLMPHFDPVSYSQMPLIDNRPTFNSVSRTENVNYQGTIYDSDTYARAKEKMFGRRSYDSYKYHSNINHGLPNSRVHTVSQSVSNSTTMPNLNKFTNLYPSTSMEGQCYTNPAHQSHNTSPNDNHYGLSSSSPTYISTQSTELYSPTGHTDLTNPYRMSNTPLVSDDGSYSHVLSPTSQHAYELYDSIPPSHPPSVISNQHSPSSSSEQTYARGQPPPYHIAAPFTKHAQYFNGTGG
ncbi:Erbin [Eumeta japonica]|uniref:Erbin n=1 Tax=Eumeta variegata TaxID=151549 RepID=A0A4C2ADB6_EUMVA|nr:Erbin [Eumeta japonica]